VRGIAPDAMTRLLRYDWPGNVRELEHAMERAVILASGSKITAHDLPHEVRGRARGAPASADAFDLERHERQVIQQALDRFKGNRAETAKALNISTVTLWRKMKRYKLAASE
jgi:DNA-binding NtrC family response regulator